MVCLTSSRAYVRLFIGLLLLSSLLLPRALPARPLTSSELSRLTTQMQSDNPKQRINTAMQLGYAHDPQAAEVLLTACHDSDAGVREAVVNALALTNSVKIFAPLREMASDAEPRVRVAVARALGSCIQLYYWVPGLPNYTNWANVYKNPQSVAADIREKGQAAFKQVGWAENIATLLGMLNDTDIRVRLDAALSLYSYGDQRGVPSLYEGMQLPDKEARLYYTRMIANN